MKDKDKPRGKQPVTATQLATAKHSSLATRVKKADKACRVAHKAYTQDKGTFRQFLDAYIDLVKTNIQCREDAKFRIDANDTEAARASLEQADRSAEMAKKWRRYIP